MVIFCRVLALVRDMAMGDGAGRGLTFSPSASSDGYGKKTLKNTKPGLRWNKA